MCETSFVKFVHTTLTTSGSHTVTFISMHCQPRFHMLIDYTYVIALNTMLPWQPGNSLIVRRIYSEECYNALHNNARLDE
jgi:hypothetical protein